MQGKPEGEGKGKQQLIITGIGNVAFCLILGVGEVEVGKGGEKHWIWIKLGNPGFSGAENCSQIALQDIEIAGKNEGFTL